jgi:hypothetical protein
MQRVMNGIDTVRVEEARPGRDENVYVVGTRHSEDGRTKGEVLHSLPTYTRTQSNAHALLLAC